VAQFDTKWNPINSRRQHFDVTVTWAPCNLSVNRLSVHHGAVLCLSVCSAHGIMTLVLSRHRVALADSRSVSLIADCAGAGVEALRSTSSSLFPYLAVPVSCWRSPTGPGDRQTERESLATASERPPPATCVPRASTALTCRLLASYRPCWKQPAVRHAVSSDRLSSTAGPLKRATLATDVRERRETRRFSLMRRCWAAELLSCARRVWCHFIMIWQRRTDVRLYTDTLPTAWISE